jgi:type IV pilus assembly protein PilF
MMTYLRMEPKMTTTFKALTALMAGTVLMSGCALFQTPMTAQQEEVKIARRAQEASTPTVHESNKTKANIYLSMATVYYQDGHPRMALKQITTAIGYATHSPDIYNVGGLAYAKIGDPKKAGSYFRKAIKYSQSAPQYLNNYGAFLIGEHLYSKAVLVLGQAANNPLYPTPQYSLVNMAKAYIRMGDYSKAHQSINRALYLVSNYPPALLMKAMLQYKEKNYFKSQGNVELVLAQQPHDPMALLLGGNDAMHMGNQREATELWKKCVLASPYSSAGVKAQRQLQGLLR